MARFDKLRLSLLTNLGTAGLGSGALLWGVIGAGLWKHGLQASVPAKNIVHDEAGVALLEPFALRGVRIGQIHHLAIVPGFLFQVFLGDLRRCQLELSCIEDLI